MANISTTTTPTGDSSDTVTPSPSVSPQPMGDSNVDRIRSILCDITRSREELKPKEKKAREAEEVWKRLAASPEEAAQNEEKFKKALADWKAGVSVIREHESKLRALLAPMNESIESEAQLEAQLDVSMERDALVVDQQALPLKGASPDESPEYIVKAGDRYYKTKEVPAGVTYLTHDGTRVPTSKHYTDVSVAKFVLEGGAFDSPNLAAMKVEMELLKAAGFEVDRVGIFKKDSVRAALEMAEKEIKNSTETLVPAYRTFVMELFKNDPSNTELTGAIIAKSVGQDKVVLAIEGQLTSERWSALQSNCVAYLGKTELREVAFGKLGCEGFEFPVRTRVSVERGPNTVANVQNKIKGRLCKESSRNRKERSKWLRSVFLFYKEALEALFDPEVQTALTGKRDKLCMQLINEGLEKLFTPPIRAAKRPQDLLEYLFQLKSEECSARFLVLKYFQRADGKTLDQQKACMFFLYSNETLRKKLNIAHPNVVPTGSKTYNQAVEALKKQLGDKYDRYCLCALVFYFVKLKLAKNKTELSDRFKLAVCGKKMDGTDAPKTTKRPKAPEAAEAYDKSFGMGKRKRTPEEETEGSTSSPKRLRTTQTPQTQTLQTSGVDVKFRKRRALVKGLLVQELGFDPAKVDTVDNFKGTVETMKFKELQKLLALLQLGGKGKAVDLRNKLREYLGYF